MPARTFRHLRAAVAGYLLREESAFVMNGFNVLTEAINNAHQFIQRTYIFERAAVDITVPAVSLTDGADLSTAVVRGTTTPVEVRTLKHAWLPSVNGGELPVGIVTRDAWVARQRRKNDYVVDIRDAPTSPTAYGNLPLEVVLGGSRIHLSTANPSYLNGQTSIDIHFDAIEWFPDYVEDDDSDLLSNYAFDLLIMESLVRLNFFLKEDQRVAISEREMVRVWESVKHWDASFSFNSGQITLD